MEWKWILSETGSKRDGLLDNHRFSKIQVIDSFNRRFYVCHVLSIASVTCLLLPLLAFCLHTTYVLFDLPQISCHPIFFIFDSQEANEVLLSSVGHLFKFALIRFLTIVDFNSSLYPHDFVLFLLLALLVFFLIICTL